MRAQNFPSSLVAIPDMCDERYEYVGSYKGPFDDSHHQSVD